MASLSELVAESARDKLDLAKAKLQREHSYASLPLCVVDAVFSIGVKYSGVTPTVMFGVGRDGFYSTASRGFQEKRARPVARANVSTVLA